MTEHRLAAACAALNCAWPLQELGSLLGPLSALSVIPGSSSQWRVTQQAAIFRPNSFPSHPRGPSWTSRRTTRSGQSRPRRRFLPSMRAFASPYVRSCNFFRRTDVREFTDAQNFLKQGPRKVKEIAMSGQTGLHGGEAGSGGGLGKRAVTELERKHLVETDRHIAECKNYIAKQRELIERAIQRGRSTEVAETTLEALEESLRAFERRRRLLLDRLKERE